MRRREGKEREGDRRRGMEGEGEEGKEQRYEWKGHLVFRWRLPGLARGSHPPPPVHTALLEGESRGLFEVEVGGVSRQIDDASAPRPESTGGVERL